MHVIDIESFDPKLKTLGDGSVRKDGHILCAGVYDGSNYKCLTPDKEALEDILASNDTKILHNAMYDLSWLHIGYGFTINGVIHDTMTRQAMINEYVDLDLDSCCKYYGLKGKNKDETIEAWFNEHKKALGLRGSVWQHADAVWNDPIGREKMIEYNRQDCIATWELFQAQEKLMSEIAEPYSIECRLIPLLLEMKRTGIRIDDVARDQFTAFIQRELKDTEQELEYKYGLNRKIIASSKQMTEAMAALGIKSPALTEKGAPSWGADALEMIDHPCAPLIQKVKNYRALLDKYLLASFQESVVNSRIHTTFLSTKRDKGGAISGRLASRAPNLQNVSSRQEKHGQPTYGQKMRSMFLPEEGMMLAATDYTAIEARLLAHYAVGPQAEWLRQRTREGVDYHTATMEVTGIKDRGIMKTLNYGIMYGMGPKTMFEMNRKIFGTLEHTMAVFSQYHEGLPVIRHTTNAIQNTIKAAGVLKTLGGRVIHKPKPVYKDGKWNDQLYKMLNRLIQGTAADILKKAMVDIWESGLCNTLKMHLTVHDELVCSVPYNKEGTEALKEMNQLMVNSYKDRLLVPMAVGCEVGPNWGYWESDLWEQMLKGEYKSLKEIM